TNLVPRGLAARVVNGAGDYDLFIADGINHVIRKLMVRGTSKVIKVIAGNGQSGFQDGAGNTAEFALVMDVAVDSVGNVYVDDSGNNRIRKLTPGANGEYTVSTIAGTGVSTFDGDGNDATAHSLYQPFGIGMGYDGNLYIADTSNYRIRKI